MKTHDLNFYFEITLKVFTAEILELMYLVIVIQNYFDEPWLKSNFSFKLWSELYNMNLISLPG